MAETPAGVRPFDWLRVLDTHPLEGVPDTEQKLVMAAAAALLLYAPGSARKDRGWTFYASAGDLALHARMSERSTSTALRRLREAGFLVLVRRGGGRRVRLASTYQLSIPGTETPARGAGVSEKITRETPARGAGVNGVARHETPATKSAGVSARSGTETPARGAEVSERYDKKLPQKSAETPARGADHWSTYSTGVLKQPSADCFGRIRPVPNAHGSRTDAMP